MPRSQRLSDKAIDICHGEGSQHPRYRVKNSCRGLRRRVNSPTRRIYLPREIITFNIPGSFQAYFLTAHTDRGDLVLYRGVQKAKLFTLHRLATTHTRLRLMEVHARSLADSVISFNAVHCNVSRTETEWFKDRTFLLEELCLGSGLDPEPPITSLLYSGYALEEWCGVRKFGAHYVKLRTPLTNVRITTFVCNE